MKVTLWQLAARPQAETDAAWTGQTVIAFGETLVDQFPDRNVRDGAPFNVACHLGALGAHPVLLTRCVRSAARCRSRTISLFRSFARGSSRWTRDRHERHALARAAAANAC